ncbi:hypothetical protein ATO67_21905 [Agrobacterium bohemicum]|uniref:Uncharacterized protein n=1 Tax=Agrobacterium bohemicum TaxID=2052828 RepID=A0A135P6A6_9HYPH|nr:hypothetical protein ATO67_21905 [Agrobacterium bohemicum]
MTVFCPSIERITWLCGAWALEIIISSQSSVSTKLKSEICYSYGVFDDAMSQGKSVGANRKTGIDIPRDRCRQEKCGHLA